MKRILIAKISEISAGVSLVLLGGLLFLLGLISLVYGERSIFVAIVLLVMAILGIELGVFWIKRFYMMKDVLQTTPPKRLVAIAAGKAVYLIFLITLIRIFFALIGFFVGYYLVIKYLFLGINEVDFLSIIIYFGAVIVYFAVLRLLLKPKASDYFKNVMKKITADYPKVEVQNNNLIINLGKGYPENRRQLSVSLDEILDIKLLNRYQGIGLVKYVLGPDVEFGVRTVKDKMDYLQGKIERPVFFSYLQNSTGAKTLYLAGPEILYLFGVQDDHLLEEIIVTKFSTKR